jgi:phospholipid/cholesterol/gamma-HCH transport system permease protein
MCHVTSIIISAYRLALRRGSWRPTLRGVVAKQILFTGVDAIRLISLMALLMGVSVVGQAQVRLNSLGQSEMLGPLLVAVIIREIGPLLVNFMVIGRSGTAVAAELANMQVRREIHVLDAQGIDPMIYLVMPRIIAFTASIFALAVLFVAISLLSGYGMGILLGATAAPPGVFFRNVLGSVSGVDLLGFVAKTTIPGAVTCAICCREGLGISGVVTDVPQAVTRGVVKSLTAVAIISSLISVLTW